MPVQNQLVRFSRFKRPFESTFRLRFQDYMDPIFGFNVIKLDQHLGVPDGTSTSDFIKNKYGEKAVRMVREMLG